MMGGRGAILVRLALCVRCFGLPAWGMGNASASSLRSSKEAWIVISCERVDASEVWREWDDCEEMVETSELSERPSLSDEELWSWLSSSGKESLPDCWVLGLVARGRMTIQGGHSFMRFFNKGVS